MRLTEPVLSTAKMAPCRQSRVMNLLLPLYQSGLHLDAPYRVRRAWLNDWSGCCQVKNLSGE
jgi:hypothetical protein